MKLIGMLDSPYVRRVAISLELYGVDFVHEPLSVFSTFSEFHGENPARINFRYAEAKSFSVSKRPVRSAIRYLRRM